MDKLELARLEDTPFYNKETQSVVFPYRPIRDVIFVLQLDIPEKIGSIFIPEQYREDYSNGYGLVLAVGPGYYDKGRHKFIPTELEVGQYVIFDKMIPWRMDAVGVDGKSHEVRYMGEQDVKVILTI